MKSRKKRNLKIAAAVALVLLLAACTLGVKFTLKVSDIDQVASDKKGVILIPGQLSLPVLDEDSEEGIKNYVLESFRSASFVEKREDVSEMQEELVFDIQMPLINLALMESFDSSEDLFLVLASKNRGVVECSLHFNRDKFEDLNDYTEDVFMTGLDIENMAISFELKQDLDKPLDLTSQALYVNRQAWPFEKTVSFAPGKEIDFKFSDLLLEYMEDEDDIPLFSYEK